MDWNALLLQIQAMGAARAAVIDAKEIRLDRSFREICRTNACGSYGACWTCPPDAGDIDDLMKTVRSFEKAIVYQTVTPLEDSYDFEGMMDAAHRHAMLACRLTELFSGLAFSRTMHLGAGGCHLCPVCAKRTGEPCRHPEQALPALEACGIDVSALAASSGMQYINGQNTVTYFGALLLCEA